MYCPSGSCLAFSFCRDREAVGRRVAPRRRQAVRAEVAAVRNAVYILLFLNSLILVSKLTGVVCWSPLVGCWSPAGLSAGHSAGRLLVDLRCIYANLQEKRWYICWSLCWSKFRAFRAVKTRYEFGAH